MKQTLPTVINGQLYNPVKLVQDCQVGEDVSAFAWASLRFFIIIVFESAARFT